MKNEGVRGVGIVAAIDLAGHDHSHWWLALFHGANLHGRSVRPEEQRLRSTLRKIEVEGVHVVADRMELWDVERFEIVVGRFDFRALHDGEANGEENIFDLLENLTNEMV